MIQVPCTRVFCFCFVLFVCLFFFFFSGGYMLHVAKTQWVGELRIMKFFFFFFFE